MLESINFHNFKVLKNAQLKLRPFNVVVGPNGSGKSTIFKAIATAKSGGDMAGMRTNGTPSNELVSLTFAWKKDSRSVAFETRFEQSQNIRHTYANNVRTGTAQITQEIIELLNSIAIYSLDASKIAEAAPLNPDSRLSANGGNLVAALDNLRDKDEEAFNNLKTEMRDLLPEFDNIIFETPGPNIRLFKLRQKVTKQSVSAKNLSEGTLLALCLLLIVHEPESPSLLCLEEPDKGLHPRLLRSVRDALYRLSYPQQFGLDRKPVQIIVTTHSPYLLDLFKEHPEDIIIAEKHADSTASFKCLADDQELRKLIGDAPLGEVWYSGLLGGVPANK